MDIIGLCTAHCGALSSQSSVIIFTEASFGTELKPTWKACVEEIKVFPIQVYKPSVIGLSDSGDIC